MGQPGPMKGNLLQILFTKKHITKFPAAQEVKSLLLWAVLPARLQEGTHLRAVST